MSPTSPPAAAPLRFEDIVLLSTADWDNPFWTNKQHVARELARRGHRVLYVESLGLRRPSTSAQDMGRLWRRLKRGLKPPRRIEARLWVWSPLVIPLQGHAFIRRINRALVTVGLKGWGAWLGLAPKLLWTYNPMTTRFVDLRSYAASVYHCVDEIKAQPGMPVLDIERAETELIRNVGLCFVTAEHLLETRRLLNPETHYFPNVADFEHFAAARDAATVVPADLAALPAPRIGFVGAISGYKVDFALLRTVAMRRPEWSIILIGKVGEGDPWTDTAALQGLPNLHLLGARPYDALPAYLKGFDVAILPSMINEYTRSMFPMKFFEYLAAGKPVVSTDLHALGAYAHVATLAPDADRFIAGIEAALAGQGAGMAARVDAARDQTYARRTDRMMAMVDAKLGSRPPG